MTPLPALMLVALPLLQSPIESGTAAPRRTVLPREPVSMPLDTSSGRPVVEVMIAGRGPFPMILDTGAQTTVLFADLAAELELEVIGHSRLGDPTNPGAHPVEVVALPVLQVGDATFEELEAVSWKLPPGMSLPGTRGILGLPIFAECLLTIDYSGRSMRLEQGALPEANGRDVLELLGESGTLPAISLTVMGQVVETHLDTGFPGGTVLPARLKESLPLVEGSEIEGRGMRASGPVEFTGGTLDGSMRVGGITLEQPELRFDPLLEWGNLGAEVFAQCVFTIDQAGRRVRLAPVVDALPASCGAPVVTQGGGRRRLGVSLMPADGTLRVVDVAPDSLGERAGLRTGDILLEVDASAVSFGDQGALVAALNADDAFTLTVERDGERVQLEVPAAS